MVGIECAGLHGMPSYQVLYTPKGELCRAEEFESLEAAQKRLSELSELPLVMDILIRTSAFREICYWEREKLPAFVVRVVPGKPSLVGCFAEEFKNIDEARESFDGYKNGGIVDSVVLLKMTVKDRKRYCESLDQWIQPGSMPETNTQRATKQK